MDKQTTPVSRTCTLVIPGLLDIPGEEQVSAFAQVGRLPALEQLLSRADRQTFSGVSLESVIFDLFEVKRAPELDTPIAPVTYIADSGKPLPASTAWCLRADPVHLVPDRDHLVLMGPEALSLTQPEADRLAADFNGLYSADGWRLEACTPSRWYLHLPENPNLRTYDLAQVRGRAISHFLPIGVNGKQWHGVMNEVQMLLHTSVVNTNREMAGQLPVSSLWFWGGGKTLDPGHSRWSTLWSQEALSIGLAALSSTPRLDLPDTADSWLQTSISPGAHLLVLDGLQQAWQNQGTEAWAQTLQQIEVNWITPLLTALRKRELESLTLCTCQGQQFVLTRAGLRRWWRRTLKLTSYYSFADK
ncbi:MAG: hypothetical protein COB30_009590 [Ectothiorhodospiraceae bacterium]|nr:hypothetical protein [Ectothiorhodospiraceae bacterium]